MDQNSPFAKDVPIIGQPQILGMSPIVLLQCKCEKKELLMGPIGPTPFVCHSCNKMWAVDAAIKISVTQILNPVDSTDKNLIQ